MVQNLQKLNEEAVKAATSVKLTSVKPDEREPHNLLATLARLGSNERDFRVSTNEIQPSAKTGLINNSLKIDPASVTSAQHVGHEPNAAIGHTSGRF